MRYAITLLNAGVEKFYIDIVHAGDHDKISRLRSFERQSNREIVHRPSHCVAAQNIVEAASTSSGKYVAYKTDGFLRLARREEAS